MLFFFLNYQYYQLDMDKENIYLLVKTKKADKKIREIFNFIIPYLELYLNYSLEVFSIFFIPHLLNIRKVDDFGKMTAPLKQKSVLNHLKDSRDYGFEFNMLISELINQRIYFEPINEFFQCEIELGAFYSLMNYISSPILYNYFYIT